MQEITDILTRDLIEEDIIQKNELQKYNLSKDKISGKYKKDHFHLTFFRKKRMSRKMEALLLSE